MKLFIISALLLTSLTALAQNAGSGPGNGTVQLLNNPCAENRDAAISDLIKATAEAIVGNQVKSTDFKNEVVLETLGGSVVLSIAGKVPTTEGDVTVLGSFECSELTTKYVLRGLTISK